MTSRSELREQGAAGFSLLETLLVLAIAAMVIGVAAPALRNGSDRRELQRAVVETAAILRAARAEAVLSGEDTTVTLNLADRQVLGSWTGQVIALPDNMKIEVTSARAAMLTPSAPSIRFFADGSATGGEISLTSSSGEGQIGIDWLSGRVDRSISSNE